MEQTTIDKNTNSAKKQLSPKNIAQIVYLCQALSFFFGITAIAGIILNYLKFDEVKGTWLESHFMWQTATRGCCEELFLACNYCFLHVNRNYLYHQVNLRA
ncbi:hypothetical protein GAMM_340003 [Gammaproteobacteria bacterium]